MNLRQCFLTQNECYLKGKPLNPTGVMVHSTGANNPKLSRYVAPDDGLLGYNKNGNHWNRFRPDGRQVCVHAFIGELKDGSVAAYQTLPWDFRGWHCAGSGNNTHIGFEICEDGLKDPAYFKAVYREAVELTAFLCKKFSLDPLAPGVVLCHAEGHARGIASNHGDVNHWFPKFGCTMDGFRQDVFKELNGKEAINSMTEQAVLALINDHNPVYHTLEDVPSWYHDTIHKLMNRGVLKGTGQPGVIDVTDDYCRVMTTLDRMGRLE